MIGETISHYKILKKTGQGGMGEVYLAYDTSLDRKVAIKILPESFQQDETARKRFLREARSAAALDHPFICNIHEVFEFEGKDFIVMEYVEGETLKERLGQGPIPLKEALQIALEIAEALEKAHRKGIIHRDLKPANVMLTLESHAKVMDFGLAKQILPSKGLSQEDTLTALTMERTTLGTLAYMSPEQLRGQEATPRSDIFSFGIVFYEMLTGVHPFRKDSGMGIALGILNEIPPGPSKEIKEGSEELDRIVAKMLAKNADDRYLSVSGIVGDLRALNDRLIEPQLVGASAVFRTMKRPRVFIPTSLGLLVVVLMATWLFNRLARTRWAEVTLLPEIEQLIMAEGAGRDNLIDAYRLVEEAEKYLSGNPKLSELESKCAVNISVETEPPGARIWMKKYSAPDDEWEFLGVSPLKNVRLPMGIFRWKVEKDGYETVSAASCTYGRDESKQYFNIPYNFNRVLDRKGSLPSGMVRVAGGRIQGVGDFDDFLVDQFEVTNRQFKEFVDKGGYQKREYWNTPFVRDGKVLTWEEATAALVDQTGRPGPSTWQAGTFPKGQEDHPVSGVSWYEAAAFAEFAGKRLPTSYHWGIARGDLTSLYQSGFLSILYPFCNFQGSGPAPVGSYQGMTAYGTYDMGGNVREWCWNETPQGRLVRGGAWNDINYMFGDPSQAPPFDRSPKNGFRCVRFLDPQRAPEIAFQPVKFAEVTDFYNLKPVPDSVFQVYRDQFSYDKKELNARVESKDEKAKDWVKEKVTFDAIDDNERMMAYLFLPRNSRPPYQTVIYFPGASAQQQKSSQDLEKYVWFEVDLSFLLQDGRAVLFPIYMGTFERVDPKFLNRPPESRLNTEYYVRVIKEFRRCIDYLETRPDIDAGKIAYLGFSWGGSLGAIIPAVEKRLKVSIIKSGGLRSEWRPEINEINYVSRVMLPTLMLSGRYDMTFPYETSAKPMFDLLGTPKVDKVLKLYNTDHFIPRNEFIKETLTWLDKYLGRPR